jgi:hypothetical protein
MRRFTGKEDMLFRQFMRGKKYATDGNVCQVPASIFSPGTGLKGPVFLVRDPTLSLANPNDLTLVYLRYRYWGGCKRWYQRMGKVEERREWGGWIVQPVTGPNRKASHPMYDTVCPEEVFGWATTSPLVLLGMMTNDNYPQEEPHAEVHE